MNEANIEVNAARYLSKIRTTAPRIHCLTNSVVQNQTANMLLSIGAQPSMSTDIDEVADFTASAQALLVNLGTLDNQRKNSILAAISTANAHNIPWILDPVLINRAPQRLAFAKDILALKPSVIRGNKTEIETLDSSIENLALRSNAIVVCTGAEDLITTGHQSTRVSSGHPLMAHVTGMGCSGTAILAAFVAVASNRFEAVVAAISTFGDVGHTVGENVVGPGSFEPSFLDKLYQTSRAAGEI